MFWLHRNLAAKQVLNSKQYAKGYERIIRQILRRSGYFNNALYKEILTQKLELWTFLLVNSLSAFFPRLILKSYNIPVQFSLHPYRKSTKIFDG